MGKALAASVSELSLKSSGGRHLAKSENMFGSHNPGEVAFAMRWKRPGVLLNTLYCTGQPLPQRIIQSKTLTVPRVRN